MEKVHMLTKAMLKISWLLFMRIISDFTVDCMPEKVDNQSIKGGANQ